MKKKLLFIGVPTFNRAIYLDKCLCSLLPQIKNFADKISFFISDNASTDNTTEVVEKFKLNGYDINYSINEENLGMDGNFAALYKMADAKYVWMFSDDDILLPNILEKIIDILEQEELGVLYLNHSWYDNEIDQTQYYINAPTKLIRYDNPLEFVERVNYWFTFLTGNIINKDLYKEKIDLYEYDKTYLLLLNWIIPTAFQNHPNFVLENCAMACKSGNTGGYALYEVFGKNFNYIMDSMIKKGIPKELKTIINKHLLSTFFPSFIKLRSDKFVNENYLKTLFPIYWNNKLFWKKIMWPYFKSKLKSVKS